MVIAKHEISLIYITTIASATLKPASQSGAWDVTGGIPQNARRRLGGGEVCLTLQNDVAIPKTATVHFLRKKCNGNCLACTLITVWQHGSEGTEFCFAYGGHPVVNEARICVCSGSADENKPHLNLLFIFGYVETRPTPPPMSCVATTSSASNSSGSCILLVSAKGTKLQGSLMARLAKTLLNWQNM